MKFHINSSKAFGGTESIYWLAVQELVLKTLSLRNTPQKQSHGFKSGDYGAFSKSTKHGCHGNWV
jgi:hypothetical protein